MDIPLAEELELLEASSFFPDEEFEDLEPPVEEPPNPISPIPPKPSPDPFSPSETQLDSRKRSRPVIVPDRPTLTNPEPSPVDKRSKIVSPEAEIDDDWLRYSPPPPVEQLVVEDPPPSVDMVMEKKKFVSRYAWEIEGECLPVTAPDGERVYAKISSADNQLVKLDLKLPSKGLIPEPINVLIQRVEQDAFRKVLKASVECPIDVILPEAPVVSEKLWVEKYAPSSFMELLSDEQTNREVLMWLKQWDSCVFGSEIKSTTNDVLSALKRHSSVVQHKNTSTKSYYGRDREPRFSKEAPREFSNVDQENYGSQGSQELWNKKRDGSGPPEQKILLLCGPPGLGKTTLAHVAAKHCGYRVVEINASDDRASSTIETKILDVVQMNSVMADSRPKCLIIDEIDGALGDGKGAVDVILKMVSADKRSDTGKENVAQGDLSGKMSAKKKRKDTSLLRPVICICNDLYAPALRPLRQVAKVHIFIQPTVVRIVNRLKYICTKEGMRTTSIALTALAEYTECDIRSCLNTLQFLNKKKESLNVLDVSSQVVGRKDTSKSVFDIWKEIFWKRIVKRETKSVSGCKSMLNEFDFLHSMISSRGDYDLIVDGIHENLLQLQYHDPMMQKTVKCLRNLEVSDIFYQYVMRTQRMSLQVYQPAIAISVHGLIAQVEKPNIEWPKSYQRYRTTLAEKVDVLHSWHNKVSPNISRHLSTKSFVEDLISPLLHILSPPTLRPCIQNILYSLQECPFLFMIMKNNGHSFWNGGSNIYVALHLLSEKEKKYMEQLVTMMVSYSITYRNAKSDLIPGSLRNEVAIDASVLLLDPPIYEFINFKDYISSYFVLASAVKQVLFHEVEKQKILQAGINKSLPAADMSDNRKQASVGIEVGKPLSTRSDKATVLTDRITNPKTLSNSRHCEMAASDASTSVPCKSSTTNETVKSSESKPKRLAGSYNFFDRFKKVSANGSQKTDDGKKVPATMERDSRPIIFKFNEGFTNAVKRPVRIREFLL